MQGVSNDLEAYDKLIGALGEVYQGAWLSEGQQAEPQIQAKAIMCGDLQLRACTYSNLPGKLTASSHKFGHPVGVGKEKI